MNRKKSIGLLIAAALVIAQVTTAFAAGSKEAEPVTKPEVGVKENPITVNDASASYEVKADSVVYLKTEAKGDVKAKDIELSITDGATDKSAVTVVDTKTILEQINKASSLDKADLKAAVKELKKMLKKKTLGVKQTGVKSFKGWFINGKKLTWKSLMEALQSGQEIKLTAKVKKTNKYKLKVFDAEGAQQTVINKAEFGSLNTNSAYRAAWDAAASAAPQGKKFIGFATTPGATKADVEEAIAAGKGDEIFNKKKLELYPVYQ